MSGLAVLRHLDPCLQQDLPLDIGEGVPGFADPWHAQAFGTAMALAKANVFSWEEWVSTFSAEIKANPQRPDEASDNAYYRQWLTALEALIGRSGILSDEDITETAEHWRRSYLHTLHGRPIELSRNWPDVVRQNGESHDHHHHHGHSSSGMRPVPVAVDAAKLAES